MLASTRLAVQGEVISSESNTYEYDAAGNKTRESVLSGTSVQSSTDYRFNEFNQLISSVKKDEEGSAVSSKAYTYDLNGNQTTEIDSITGEEADYKYDADNRLSEATGRTGYRACKYTRKARSYVRKGKVLKKIKPGDRVWSENPETNSKALKKVKKIFVREKDSLIRLAINGEVIETTDEHPFYVEGRGFTAAKELKTGDEVRLEDGTAARIESSETRQLDRPVKVYNFEVEDYHTYYVSEQKVLVHNTCARNKNNDTVINKEKSLFLPEEYYKKIDNNIAKATKARDEEVARIQSLSKNQQKDITTVAAGVDLRTEEVFVGAKSGNVYAGQTTCAEDIVFRGLGGIIWLI